MLKTIGLSLAFFTSTILCFQISWAAPEHLCRSNSIAPSDFFSKILGPEKAKDLVRIRKKCIDLGDSTDVPTSGADGYVLDVAVGSLTFTEFKRFKESFGNYSRVPYEPSRSYKLADFLPPAMQAMVNKNFKTNSYSEFSEIVYTINDDMLSWIFRSGVSSSANCWNTVIENLRLMANTTDAATGTYHIYWPGRWEVSETLFDKSYSREVSRSEAQFGDVVLIYVETQFLDNGKPSGEPSFELQHASMVLTDQLVYEKVDSSDYHPYRIALFDETGDKVKALFADGLISDEYKKQSLKMQIRRFDYQKFAGSQGSKALQFDLVEGQFSGESEEEKSKYNAAVALLPQALLDLYLTVGCETGLGGGCSQQVTAVQRVKVSINPQTGYGELRPITMPDSFTEKYTGGTQVLERFVEVPYIDK